MKLNEVTSQFEMHKVLEYAADWNKVVRHNKQLRKLEEPFYSGEITGDEYSRGAKIYVFYSELNIAMYLGSTYESNNVEFILEQCRKMHMDTPAQLMETLDQLVERNEYIKNIYIEVAAMVKPERVQVYMESKKNFVLRQEEKRRLKKEQQEIEDQAYVNEHNAEAERVVQEAINLIRSNGKLPNTSVEFFRSRHDSSAYSIINYLMRKYGINVPIRTQGWINDRLTMVSIQNGKCATISYQKIRNGKVSEIFHDCMNKLIMAINAEE